MPFQKGNRLAANRASPKPFKDALTFEIKSAGDGKTLRTIAQKLLEKAQDGEPWAVQMLADRLDGKPAQTVHATSEGNASLADLTLAELAARTADQIAAIEKEMGDQDDDMVH